MSEIAVIMPFYIEEGDTERAAWLSQAIQSVIRQSFQDWELVLVSDGSPMLPQGDFSGRVKLIQTPSRRGAGAARNAGVGATRSPWIIGLDSDDVLKPEALTALYANRGERSITYGDLEWTGTRSGIEHLSDWNIEQLKALRGPIGITALFSRSAWERSGGWAEDLPGLEDIEFWMRLTEQGLWGRHIPVVTFEYRQHGNSRTQAFKKRGIEPVLVEQIRQRHRNLGNTPNGGGTAMAQVQLKYIGARLGGFTLPLAPSGKQYRCDGRGDYLMVEVEDKDWLLNFRGPIGSEWMLVEPEPPAVTDYTVVTAPVIIPEVVNFDSHIPNITEMNASGALAAIEDVSDLPDLMVLSEMEKAAPAPRKTVIKAIDKRIAALAGQDS